MSEQRSETVISEFDAGGGQQDDLFDALSNTRRRVILQSLQAAEGPVSVGELTTDIVAWEVGQSASGRPGPDRNTITVSLVHNHLPMMAGAGLIRYNGSGETVALADQSGEVEAHLQTMTDNQH